LSTTNPLTPLLRHDAVEHTAVACDENGLAVTQLGRPPVLGSNEQIFGADEQVFGRGQSD
jgi:hypothetical protein